MAFLLCLFYSDTHFVMKPLSTPMGLCSIHPSFIINKFSNTDRHTPLPSDRPPFCWLPEKQCLVLFVAHPSMDHYISHICIQNQILNEFPFCHSFSGLAWRLSIHVSCIFGTYEWLNNDVKGHIWPSTFHGVEQ